MPDLPVSLQKVHISAIKLDRLIQTNVNQLIDRNEVLSMLYKSKMKIDEIFIDAQQASALFIKTSKGTVKLDRPIAVSAIPDSILKSNSIRITYL